MFAFFCGSVSANPRDLHELADLICDAAKLPSLEKLAIALDQDDKQLRRQLDGEGHFSLTRVVAKLGAKDPGFWPRLAWLLACRYGVPKEAKRAAMLTFGVLGNRRQLKMAARQASHRRSA
jgi:hypothetical protein